MTAPVSVRDMAALLCDWNKKAPGRYESVTCFSDDVAEILARAEREVPEAIELESFLTWRPGQFEFLLNGEKFTATMNSKGGTMVRPGWGLERVQYQVPYATLSVQRAETLKQGGGPLPVFVALKGPEKLNILICLVLEHGEWFMPDEKWFHLGLWAKRVLYHYECPEVSCGR